MSWFSKLKKEGCKRCSDVWRIIRRPVIGGFGGLVLLLGIIMIVTPGPALVLIPLGVGILNSQFPIVRKWIKPIREKLTPLIAWAKRKWRSIRSRWIKTEKTS